jgi:hypothetical protein
VASRPAQAQLAGPAQVKIYKDNCSEKLSECTKYTDSLESVQGSGKTSNP